MVKINNSKVRAESVPIEKALEMIKKLSITKKEYATVFCALSDDTQFFNWQKRGYMPANRFWASQNALKDYFFKEYQEKMRIISDN